MSKKRNESQITDATQMYITASKSLVDYRHVILTNDIKREVEPAPFQYEISDSLLFGDQDEAIEAFRESAKTQLVLRAYPHYCLTFPAWNRSYIVIIANNKTRARERLSDIEREFDSNPMICPNVKKIHSKSSERFCLDIENSEGKIINVLMVAVGKGENIRGMVSMDRRPDIVIADDIQDKEDARSEVVLTRDWKWWKSDVEFLGQHTRIFLIGNNLGESCVIEQVIEGSPRNGYKVRRIPILDEHDEIAWPDKYTREEIIKEKNTFIAEGELDIWLMERMCTAVNDETRLFREEDYNYYSPGSINKVMENCNVYMNLDPASSKEMTACFRAFVVVAVDAKDNWFIVDIPFGRWDTTETLEIMFDKVKQYHLPDVGIEKGWYEQIVESVIKEKQARKKSYFNVVKLEHSKMGSKHERIKALQPRVKAGRLWLPEERDDNREWLNELKSELAGVTRTAIKSKFIDLVDCLAMHLQTAEAPVDDDYEMENKKTVISDSAFDEEERYDGELIVPHTI